MSDRPVRWLDGGQAGRLERELLAQARSGEPPAGAEDRIWAALALRLPPGPGGDGSSGGEGGIGGDGGGIGAAGQALGTLGALKAGGIGALAGLIVATGATLIIPSGAQPVAPPSAPAAEATEQPPPAVTPASHATEPSLPDEPRELTVPTRRVPPPSTSAAAAPASSVASLEPPARTSQLSEESQALQAVRDALRRGDGAGALATLEATRRRFPASVLGQEREALTIQALALAGQRDAARERARAFIAKFPTSPHAPILARFADPAGPK